MVALAIREGFGMIAEGLYRRRRVSRSAKPGDDLLEVLEVHDEPRVTWTNEPTCLVRGRYGVFVWKQSRVLELADKVTA